jgi:hypothetical protein
MKKLISYILVMVHITLLSQTGTIKIQKAKPQTKEPPVIVQPKRSNTAHCASYFGMNYTLKNNSKIGYEGGIVMRINRKDLQWGTMRKTGSLKRIFKLGLEYSVEHQNHFLKRSGENSEGFISQKANVHSQYLKIPMELGYYNSGVKTRCLYFGMGIKTEYLLKARTENEKLNNSGFNRLNLASTITAGYTLNSYLRLCLTYSKDFFENLKDRNIYDSNGAVTGKQRSKTNLLNLTLSYGI